MRRFADFGTFKFERTAGCGCVLVRGHFSGDEEKSVLEGKGFAWELIWGVEGGGIIAGVDHSVFEINLSLFGVPIGFFTSYKISQVYEFLPNSELCMYIYYLTS